MTPEDFRRKWTDHGYTEEQAYQQHFSDLCAVAGFERPHDPAAFAFQKHVTKLRGTPGAADVWLRGCFGWEYKGPGADLDAAYRQLAEYREGLENPPLLVVSDLDRVTVHTNFPNTAKRTHTFTTATIGEPETRHLLEALFTDPERLNPRVTREVVSQEAARRVADVFDSLTARGVEAHPAAHFLMRLVFCLFAEDVRLLPARLVTDLLARRRDDSERLNRQLSALFAAMSTGGDFGSDEIRHFDGGLFDERPTVALTPREIALLAEAATLDWSQVEPSIFGSLLEGALSHNEALRRRLGAHYTARSDIELIVAPVVMEPLQAEWAAVLERCEGLAGGATGTDVTTARRKKIGAELAAFRERLGRVEVLDPACGSGNFLYVALACLLELEHEVRQTGGRWGLQPDLLVHVGPHQLHGLDLDPWAVELASATVWIGYLQWRHEHVGIGSEAPLLKPLDTIREANAILTPEDTEPAWPECDVIVGNPPFLGDKMMRAGLGDGYVERLRRFYGERVPGGADLCCYWFERAQAEIAAGRAKRAGLLATNSIRQGRNRVVLDRILDTGGIFMAWSDRDWREDGAAVRISMIGFDNGSQSERTLDGAPKARINADLTSGVDLTSARRLAENAGIAFIGTTKKGPFDIPGDLARRMLAAPNPLGRDNADVVKRYYNGDAIIGGWADRWIVDFGEMSEQEAALYEAPFEYVRQTVRPLRVDHRELRQQRYWWLLARPVPDLKRAIASLPRFLATVIVAKHRLFAWLPPDAHPDHALAVFARDDDYLFGVLHSRPHELWALGLASALEDRPRYTPTTCFETFPFPDPTPEQREAIGAAAKALHETRQSALDNYPALTLTGLYNRRPTWLANLHAALDAAVLAAYGWPADLPDEALLERLLTLNLERAGAATSRG